MASIGSIGNGGTATTHSEPNNLVAYHEFEIVGRDNSMIARLAKLLFVGLIFSATCAPATELIVQKGVSVSRSLAGQVFVGTEEPLSGVTVELCSPDWKDVIASAKTDNKGHFSLEPITRSKLFYVRVSAPNMNIYQLRVRIDKHAEQGLNIHLSVAT